MLQVFNFDSFQVRTVSDEHGNPLFVGKDVCTVLGYADPTTAVRSHCKGVPRLHPLQTPGGRQEVRVLAEADVMRLIVSSSLPAAQKFEAWVFEELLPTIRKTGSYRPQPPAPQTPQSVEAVMFAEAVNRALNLQGSAALGMVRGAVALKAPDYLPLLPVYSVDAPKTSELASSEPTQSLTDLLKAHGSALSAVKANKRLQELGIIEQLSRPSSNGKETRYFWSLTEAGLKYGKNLTHPSNQKEVQVHYYRTKGAELVDLLGQ